MSEFIVQKITDRHPEPTKRILCLTEATILERDPQTYSVCCSMHENLKCHQELFVLVFFKLRFFESFLTKAFILSS